jgi:hypothetical protein
MGHKAKVKAFCISNDKEPRAKELSLRDRSAAYPIVTNLTMATRDEKASVGASDDISLEHDVWAEYSRGGNIFVNNSESISRRLKGVEKKLFSNEEKMKVDFLDVVQSKIRQETV